jgi:hypothetical protein
MGGTELPGELQLAVVQVDRDDGISTGNGRGSNCRQTDASSAEYSHRLASPDPRRMQHRAGSCQHRAAK